MTEAVEGYGTTFEVHNGDGTPGTYFEFEEIKTVSPPNEEQETIDATHMQSPNRTREFISGLINPGTQQVTMNFVPGSDTDAFIIAWRAAGDTRSVIITSANGETWTYPAFPTSYDTPLAVGELAVATLGLQVAGAVVRGS